MTLLLHDHFFKGFEYENTKWLFCIKNRKIDFYIIRSRSIDKLCYIHNIIQLKLVKMWIQLMHVVSLYQGL